MQRSQLSDVSIFVEVARLNGFRAAARNLKLQAASVSEAVQRFEDRLGVRLFERSTRSVALTAIGEQLFKRSLPAINDLEAAIRDLNDQREGVSGTLRLSAPYSAGAFFLDDLVARFAIRFPDVKVDLIYDDQKVDLIESRIDAAIRSQTLLEADTHAVPVGPNLKMVVVGSPGYLKQHGVPKNPEDVLGHDGICFAFGSSGRLAPWVFDGEDGTLSVMPTPRMTVNDLRSMVLYASQGLGLAYVYAEVAAPLVNAGDLIEVMADRLPSLPRYSLNYRSKKHMTRRLRAFIDMAKETSKGSDQ
ncbi:LysR family transcriptional regulator [Hoeflea prorocentri]|uniref:LysR family transcriptional regulator n=1 Tax=Hoeflea prorocentri TaxID=1922333 RepID=A0A9X3UKW8_9HYPH|nr:LysR family transcriptional regulator [Hoeflea prorocentri]MCY6383163.1 LysR family transcriptional regulator [Hoeflea prorocentri]MDA5400963.1 LysR family transcriptional regulator [Hoeflea prorocentri]